MKHNILYPMGCMLMLGTIVISSAFTPMRHKTVEMTDVLIPEVSLKQTFAGEEVDLSRLDMYERYDREMTTFCYAHSLTSLIIKRANRYFPILDSILAQEGIPQDFVYLAAIESVLNPCAVSPMKAVGMWQIMAETGRGLGLEINEFVDERYHVEKATVAACTYLKTAYEKYGHWATAAASYNAGMHRISQELEAQQASTSFDLWLNEETSRYVFRILCLKELMSNPSKYGYKLTEKQLYQPVRCHEVTVDTAIQYLPDFAIAQGITYAQLREFNPWLRTKTLPNPDGKQYVIKIPEKESLFLDKRDFITYRDEWIYKNKKRK